MPALPRRTTKRLREVLQDPSKQARFRTMIDDLTFLASRPEEEEFIVDQMVVIHHRRVWVEERERFEKEGRHGPR